MDSPVGHIWSYEDIKRAITMDGPRLLDHLRTGLVLLLSCLLPLISWQLYDAVLKINLNEEPAHGLNGFWF